MLCRLQRLTENFFNERPAFNSDINDKFEKQIADLCEHFEENEKEDQ